LITRKKVEGMVSYNDGCFAEVKISGIEGIEKGLFLSTMQIHAQDTADTCEGFWQRFPVGMWLDICTITEVTSKSRQTSTGAAVPVTDPDSPTEPRHGIPNTLVDDIRRELNRKFPDVDDLPENEHPMTAIGVVLISAMILQSTEISRLVIFTGYSPDFISAIAFNMIHNKLWTGSGCVAGEGSTWFSLDGFVREDGEFWDQIEMACGNMWMPGIGERVSRDPCRIFWDERSRESCHREKWNLN
jgi:hypothetical protein